MGMTCTSKDGSVLWAVKRTCRNQNVSFTEVFHIFIEEEDDDDSFAPEFIRRPKSCHVDEGSPAVFTCQIAADPPPTVVWQKDGQQIVNGGRYRVSSPLKKIYIQGLLSNEYHLPVPKKPKRHSCEVRHIPKLLFERIKNLKCYELTRKCSPPIY